MTTKFEHLFGEDDAYDWGRAFGYAEDFTIDDVAMVYAKAEGSNDGDPWITVVLLNDGRWAWLTAWCDYEGWDCQAGGESHTRESLADLMLGYVGDENAARMGLDMPPPPRKRQRTRRQRHVMSVYDKSMRRTAVAAFDFAKALEGSHPGIEYDIDLVPYADKRGAFLGVEVLLRGDEELAALMRETVVADLLRHDKRTRWTAKRL